MNKGLKKIQKILEKKNLNAFLISNFENIVYLSGLQILSPREREAWLIISQKKGFLITDGRYIEPARKLKTGFKTIELGIKQSVNKDIFPKILKQLKAKNLGFEQNDLKFSEYNDLKKVLKIKLIPTENFIEDLRIIKQEQEIKNIQKACQIADSAFKQLLKEIKIGNTEKEIALRLEVLMRKKGADGIAFESIIASGKGSAVPHYHTSDKKIKKGEILLCDFGAKYKNYLSDMTRIVFLGKASQNQKKIYNAVLKAQEKALKQIRPGITGEQADKIARDEIKNSGFPEYSHSLGHGVGLEIHESPRLGPKRENILKKNMIFSVEPGIYIPGFGGIRIEDLVVLLDSGPKRLTRFPKSLLEVDL